MAAGLGTIAEGRTPNEWYSVVFADNFEDRAGHTVYKIKVGAPNGETWMIQKRYSEVRELHDSLRMWLGDRLPPIPGRRLFGNHDPFFIMERQAGLERCLNGTLRIIGSQQPGLLQCFVAQFLGCLVPMEVERGRTFSASFTSCGRDTYVNCSQRNDTSAPPSKHRDGDFFDLDFLSHFRAVSADTHLRQPMPRARANMSHAQAHNRSAATQSQNDVSASHQDCLSRSVTPHSVSATCTDAPVPQRQRRWSRRHYNITQGETSRAEVHGDAEETGLSQMPWLGKKVADDESTSKPGIRLEETLVSASSSVAGEKMLSKTASHQSVGLGATSSITLQGHEGNAWDWPLSRNEKQERLRLIDHHVSSLDREALLGEIENLRTSSGRTDMPSSCVDAR